MLQVCFSIVNVEKKTISLIKYLLLNTVATKNINVTTKNSNAASFKGSITNII